MTRAEKLMYLQHDLNDARNEYLTLDKSLGSPEFSRFQRIKTTIRLFKEETMDLGLQLPYPKKSEQI